MTIVGVVYNTILRFIWAPTGLQWIVDEMLHVVQPALAIIFWFLYVQKGKLKFTNVGPWLIYPIVYFIFIILRGSISGFYPYPFIHLDSLGMQKVMINAVMILLGFVAIAAIFIGIDRWMKRSSLSGQVT
jgi:hypothetical protein